MATKTCATAAAFWGRSFVVGQEVRVIREAVGALARAKTAVSPSDGPTLLTLDTASEHLTRAVRALDELYSALSAEGHDAQGTADAAATAT